MAIKPLALGDRVAVTRNFLQHSVTSDKRYAWAQRRGTIVQLIPIGCGQSLAAVAWDGEPVPDLTIEDDGYNIPRINTGNLCRPRSVAFGEIA